MRHPSPVASAQDVQQAQSFFDQLAGKPLIQYCVGVGVRLDFAVPTFPELTIETPITVERAGDVQVAEPHSQLVVMTLLGLLDQAAEPTVANSGQLTLRFTGGTTLIVPPDDKYEAWQLRDDDDLLIVCMPGGELAIWLPKRAKE
jgi:hypothetical protein